MNDQMMSHPPAPAMISQPPLVPIPVQTMMNPAMAPPPGGMFVPQQQQQRGGYKPWQQQNPNPNAGGKFNNNKKNWKGKNVNKDQRRMEMTNLPFGNPAGMAIGGGYQPPSLNELQNQNRMKARKYYHPKKKFNNSEGGGGNRGGGIHRNNNNRFAPYAPRNTSSFIIRAKKAGGIAELVSPYPVTPAVLPTPIFSPSREVLGDMAKEEWGVDGYGSMKGLIRLRPQTEDGEGGDEDDEEGNGSSESDVEEHVEVERRLDHDLSRFEMIYPIGEYSYGGLNNVLENRVDDQDSHIAQLEEENLTLKERLFLMERELGDLRRRMQFLERQQFRQGREDVSEEVVENTSENDDNESDGGSDIRGAGNDRQEEDVLECAAGGDSGSARDGSDMKERNDQCMEDADIEKLRGCAMVVGESSEEGKLVDGVVAADAAVSKDVVMREDTELEKVIPNPEEGLSLEDADAGKEAEQERLHLERDGSKED